MYVSTLTMRFVVQRAEQQAVKLTPITHLGLVDTSRYFSTLLNMVLNSKYSMERDAMLLATCHEYA